jgi:carboxymethylenebutenolidase
MDIITEYRQVTSDMQAFCAFGRGNENAPVIVILQEIFGVNQSMQDICCFYASVGYFVICPDLFHRLDKNINLTDKTSDEWRRAFGYYQKFDTDAGMIDIQLTIDFARTINVNVAAIGYCLGGTLAYLTALRTDINLVISYYGIGIADMLEQSDAIKVPVLLHIAGHDEYVDTASQHKIMEYFKRHNFVKYSHYPDAHHAFARIDGIHFHTESAMRANDETVAFLKNNFPHAL